MFDRENAIKFANDWLTAWNTHDLDAIMRHYADEVVFTSPLISKLIGEPTGKLVGKDALRSYFEQGLAAYPELSFELLAVFMGVDSITLEYRSIGDRRAAEVMTFGADGRVTRVLAHYDKD
jgi:hypothetical protein